MVTKISEIVSLKKFKEVIDFQLTDKNEERRLVDDYIVTEQLADHIEDILESLTISKSIKRREMGEDINPAHVERSFMVRGAYGTGKSYFLLMLGAILDSVENDRIDSLIEKFKDFEGIAYQLNKLKEDNIKYFTIRVDGVVETERDLEDAIRFNLIKKFKEVFNEYEPNSIYDNAVKKLKDDKNSPRWGLLEKQLEVMNLDFYELISSLKKYKKQGLYNYKELVERAFNTKIDLFDVHFKELMDEAFNFVKSRGYTGIAILFDEYSAYLTASIENGKINTNVSQTQFLAQATDISKGNDILFVVATHKALRDILKTTAIGKEEIEKIIGRFKELHLQYSKGNELVENTLNINPQKYSQMKESYKDAVEFVERVTNEKIRSVYPMHPKTVDYIRILSEHFAQENRTVFKFLADVVGKKIRNGNIIVEDSLNLITPDSVYDYFIADVSEENLPISQSANTAISQCKEQWQKTVVKTLVVARMSIYSINVAPDIKQGLSVDELCEFLLLTDKTKVKDFLKEISSRQMVNIYYDPIDDVYEFYESGSSKIDVEKLINEKAKEINAYDVLIKCLENHSGRFIRLDGHIVNYSTGVTPVDRRFSSNRWTLQRLTTALENCRSLYKCNDGTINYLIPDFGEMNNIRTYKIVEHMRNAPDNVSVAVPKKMNFDIEALKRYKAIEYLKNDSKLDEKTKNYLIRERDKLKSYIDDQIMEFDNIENFDLLFSKGEKREFNETNELYSFMLERYYYKFPKIKAENLSGRGTTNLIINNFISRRTYKVVGNSQTDRHIIETMKPLDLAKTKRIVDGYEATLKIPEKKNNKISAEIFDIVISPTTKTLQAKLDLLNSAPYGLPDPMIELYVSAAIALGKVRLLKDGKYVQNNSAEISKIRNSKYTLQVLDDDKYNVEDLIYAKEMWEIIAVPLASLRYKELDPLIHVNPADIDNKIIELMSDINNFNETFSVIGNWLKEKKLNVDDFSKLLDELNALSEILTPDKFIENFINIPRKLFPGKVDREAIKDFNNLIQNYSLLKEDGNHKKINNTLLFIEKLEEQSNRFKGFDRVEEVFHKLKKEKAKYMDEPYKLANLETLYKYALDLISIYNIEYKRLHDEMHEKISQGKLKLSKMPENDIISKFEKMNLNKINQSSINKLTDINAPLRNKYKGCLGKFEDIQDNSFLECDCMGSRFNLTDFQEKRKEFEKDLELVQFTITGLMGTYRKEFNELANIHNKTNKKSIREFIKDKDETLVPTYIGFMQNLNDNPVKYKEQIMQSIEKLTNILNDYIDYLSITPPPPPKTVPFSVIHNKIFDKVKHTGKSKITPQEFMVKVQEVIVDFGDRLIDID